MAEVFSTRFKRQYGLVRQDIVENMNVVVVGDDTSLPYLLLNLAFCGVGRLQGGVYLSGAPLVVEERHVAGQFLLNARDVGQPYIEALSTRLREAVDVAFDLQPWRHDSSAHLIPDVVVLLGDGVRLGHEFQHSCRVFCQVGSASVYLGHEPIVVADFPPNVLTPGIASLAGALAAQEVLRLANALRQHATVKEVLKIELTVRSHKLAAALQRTEAGAAFGALVMRLKLGGEEFKPVVDEILDGQEIRLHAELPADTFLSRMIIDSVELIEEPLDKGGGLKRPLFVNPLGIDKFEAGKLISGTVRPPSGLDALRAVVVGVGGLGAWLTGILSVSPIRQLQLSIVDHDQRVEEHNLNRQVLYTRDDIGTPKAVAARRALKRYATEIDVNAYAIEVSDYTVFCLAEGYRRQYDKEVVWENKPLDPDDPVGTDRQSAITEMLVGDLIDADAIISCLDNMRTRYLLNVIARRLDKTMINGGVAGFSGAADLIEKGHGDQSLVERYGPRIITDRQKVSCGGEIPLPSIVTSNAVIASLEALFAIATVAGLASTTSYVGYDGAGRTVYMDRLPSANDGLNADAFVEELRRSYGQDDSSDDESA